MKMKRIAIYPGSFDPVTNGHVDIAQRGLKLFDKVIVAILHNPVKNFLFTVEERVEMLESSFEAYPDIEVETFDGLLVEYASKRGSIAILRAQRCNLQMYLLRSSRVICQGHNRKTSNAIFNLNHFRLPLAFLGRKVIIHDSEGCSGLRKIHHAYFGVRKYS